MGQNRKSQDTVEAIRLTDRVIEKSIRRPRPKGDGLAPVSQSFSLRSFQIPIILHFIPFISQKRTFILLYRFHRTFRA